MRPLISVKEVFYCVMGKNDFLLLIGTFVIILFTMVSCATTTVTHVWKDNTYHQGQAQKIVVIMVAKSPDMRNLFENRFVAELNARGNNAIQSHKIVSMEQLPDRELVKSEIKSLGADTVLVSRLVDIKTIESYNPGLIYVVPEFYYGWGAYYSRIFADYGYTGKAQVVYVETNLYDMKTEKLIWTAHTKTERTEGEQQLINTFVKVIAKKMAAAGLIK